MLPEVSIIIINYNTSSLTIQCIDYIREYTQDVTYEIIVIDNASPDSTEILKLSKIEDTGLFRLIQSSENLGFSKGCNLGIQFAKGSYILLLNSDAFIKNNAIKITLDFLKDNSDYVVATTRITYPDGTLQQVCGNFPSINEAIVNSIPLNLITKRLNHNFKEKYLRVKGFDYNKFNEPDWVWGTFFLFAKNDLLSLPDQKLFDGFFMYEEDVYWCFLFNKHLKKKIAYVPDGHVVHLGGASEKGSNEGISLVKYKQIVSNRLFWLKKNRSKLFIIIYSSLKSYAFFIAALKDKRNFEISKYWFFRGVLSFWK